MKGSEKLSSRYCMSRSLPLYNEYIERNATCISRYNRHFEAFLEEYNEKHSVTVQTVAKDEICQIFLLNFRGIFHGCK